MELMALTDEIRSLPDRRRHAMIPDAVIAAALRAHHPDSELTSAAVARLEHDVVNPDGVRYISGSYADTYVTVVRELLATTSSVPADAVTVPNPLDPPFPFNLKQGDRVDWRGWVCEIQRRDRNGLVIGPIGSQKPNWFLNIKWLCDLVDAGKLRFVTAAPEVSPPKAIVEEASPDFVVKPHDTIEVNGERGRVESVYPNNAFTYRLLDDTNRPFGPSVTYPSNLAQADAAKGILKLMSQRVEPVDWLTKGKQFCYRIANESPTRMVTIGVLKDGFEYRPFDRPNGANYNYMAWSVAHQRIESGQITRYEAPAEEARVELGEGDLVEIYGHRARILGIPIVRPEDGDRFTYVALDRNDTPIGSPVALHQAPFANGTTVRLIEKRSAPIDWLTEGGEFLWYQNPGGPPLKMRVVLSHKRGLQGQTEGPDLQRVALTWAEAHALVERGFVVRTVPEGESAPDPNDDWNDWTVVCDLDELTDGTVVFYDDNNVGWREMHQGNTRRCSFHRALRGSVQHYQLVDLITNEVEWLDGRQVEALLADRRLAHDVHTTAVRQEAREAATEAAMALVPGDRIEVYHANLAVFGNAPTGPLELHNVVRSNWNWKKCGDAARSDDVLLFGPVGGRGMGDRVAATRATLGQLILRHGVGIATQPAEPEPSTDVDRALHTHQPSRDEIANTLKMIKEGTSPYTPITRELAELQIEAIAPGARVTFGSTLAKLLIAQHYESGKAPYLGRTFLVTSATEGGDTIGFGIPGMPPLFWVTRGGMITYLRTGQAVLRSHTDV